MLRIFCIYAIVFTGASGRLRFRSGIGSEAAADATQTMKMEGHTMSEIKMRTRILAHMTNYEVIDYLKRNDIIFVPVGPTEMHGRCPLDIEYIGPFGLAVAMAEKVDGLVLDGLKYFYNGSCATGEGTVRMSVKDGYNYLKAIMYSLLSQGFKRIIMVSGHGTSELTMASVMGDFFDETKHPIAWIEQGTTVQFARTRVSKEELEEYNNFRDVGMGCYEITKTKDELVIDPECDLPEKHDMQPIKPGQTMALPESLKRLGHMINFGTFAFSMAFYMGDVTDHGGTTGAFRSVEDRDAACAAGLKQLRKVVDVVDVQKYVDDMRDQMEYTQTVIREKFGTKLPWSKAFPWKAE